MEDAQPMKVAGYLLDQLGLKLKSVKKRGLLGGASWREYTLDREAFSTLLEIAETRYQQGIDRVSISVPQGSKNSYTDPCGTQPETPPNPEGEGDTGDEKETDPDSPDWMSEGSLEEIRNQWNEAESDEEREIWRQIIPAHVLEAAIAA